MMGDGSTSPKSCYMQWLFVGTCVRLHIRSSTMLMKCLKCSTRISTKWLILGLPWSKYKCIQCGSVFAGTILRFVQNTIVIGVVGFILLRVVKGKASPIILPPIILISFILFLANLPGQIKNVGGVRSPGRNCTQ